LIKQRIDWRREIMPFQWRITLSWVAGYLGAQSIIPIVFSNLGPIAAGQLGLALALMAAISGASMAWITTKTPLFGQLVSKGDYKSLAEIFSRAYKTTRLAAFLLICLMVGGCILLPIFWPKLSERLPTLVAILALSISTLCNIQVSAQATFLRTFRREPFLKISIVNGFSLAASALFFSRFGGLEMIIIGYSIVSISLAIFWAWPLFNRCYCQYMGDVK
jgi:O-antigen/teichoic acid export membrane protein